MAQQARGVGLGKLHCERAGTVFMESIRSCFGKLTRDDIPMNVKRSREQETHAESFRMCCRFGWGPPEQGAVEKRLNCLYVTSEIALAIISISNYLYARTPSNQCSTRVIAQG